MAYFGLRQIFGPLIKKKIREIKEGNNLPQQPPFIIAANHVGFMDGLAMAATIFEKYNKPLLFFTTYGMWRLWGRCLARHWLGMIPMNKNKGEGDPLDKGIKAINRGNIIGIFPEGTRNPGSSLLRGRTGAVRLALKTGVPLIPVGLISNTGHRIGKTFVSLWQKDKYINFFIGQPVDLAEFHNKQIGKPLLEAATKKLMLAISKLCGKNYPY